LFESQPKKKPLISGAFFIAFLKLRTI